MILKIIQWTAFIWNPIFWNFINVFVVILDQLNASLLNKSIHFIKKNHITDLKLAVQIGKKVIIDNNSSEPD